ncbi:MAG TPA: rhodanese-like domain-containing protein [Pyrinomonadaceae bacterium]|jgi:UPF0176 protein
MKYQIITFYEFKDLNRIGALEEIKESLKLAMRANSIFGTIILAAEGFNSTVCGESENIKTFINQAENILETNLKYKASRHARIPFRRVHVKIKPEIVTLKRQVDVEKGIGTHVSAQKWNEIISDSETILLDARNDYEYKVGTFKKAINPQTRKFSELPEFVEKNLDPRRHKKIAMFCTGGIRCEKFAPFVKDLGFEEVYQLEGGILKYLEEIPEAESLWQGECFVFDDRVSVDENLQKGIAPDLSTAGK